MKKTTLGTKQVTPESKQTNPRIIIAAAARTPLGVKCGTLSGFSAEDLAVLAAEETISRSGIEKTNIDSCVGANVYQFTAPGSQDLYFPRNVALRLGLGDEMPALLVQRICGSGIQIIVNGMQQIAMPNSMDDSRVVLCFGGETMTRAPQINRAPRKSSAFFWEFEDNGKCEDSMLASLNHDVAGTAMMLTADEYGTKVGITRQECDEFAVESHRRAREARSESHFNGGDRLKGIFALDALDRNGKTVHMESDECIRETDYETLAALPGFTPNKLISPGNASEIADGAAAVLIADYDRATELGLDTQFEIVSYGIAGVDPRIMGQGPVPSIKQALERAGLQVADVDLFEINEAFAAQYLGVEKELELDRSKVNVNGGAVALGHPLGATGARLITDLMYEMDRRGAELGCASACIGGGQGIAMIVRNTKASKQ